MNSKKLNLTISGFRSFMGMDTPGYNANLHLDGKKVAFCIEEGRGGGVNVQWLPGTETEQKRIAAYVASLPKIKVYGMELDQNLDMVIESVVIVYETAKKIARAQKNGTVFLKKGESIKDGFRTLKGPKGEGAAEWLANKFGAGNFTVIPEGADVAALFAEASAKDEVKEEGGMQRVECPPDPARLAEALSRLR